MSTRGAIARPAGDGWEGRYHHFDSYPAALGATLWDLYHGHFGRDLAAMQKFLIDDHPAGWSSIIATDLSAPAGFGSARGPECYCHGSRRDPKQLLSCNCPSEAVMIECGPLTIEWAYVLGPGGIVVYRSNGRKHEVVALYPWTGDVPDWHRL